MVDQQFRLTCTRASTSFFRWLMLYSDLIPLLVNTPGRPFWLIIHDLYILPILELLAACWFCNRPIHACHFIVVLCPKRVIVCPSMHPQPKFHYQRINLHIPAKNLHTNLYIQCIRTSWNENLPGPWCAQVLLSCNKQRGREKEKEGQEKHIRIIPFSCVLCNKVGPFGATAAPKMLDLHNLR